MSEPTFNSTRTEVTVSAYIENAPATPCQYDLAGGDYRPERVTATFSKGFTVVHVAGPRLMPKCSCAKEAEMYTTTYYPDNASRRAPEWMALWLQTAGALARRAGASR